jgi:hypothetical protein
MGNMTVADFQEDLRYALGGSPATGVIYGVAHVESTVASVTARRTKLDPIDRRDQLTLERQERAPRQYTWWNNSIWIPSVPDTASVGQLLEVVGYIQPQLLQDGIPAQQTVLRPEWDEVILKGAEWRGWTNLGEMDRAFEARQEFGMMVNEIADIRKMHAEEWGWQNQADNPQHMRID